MYVFLSTYLFDFPLNKKKGVVDYAYIPPSIPVAQSDWPTLGDLITANTRVIVFMDAGANGVDGMEPYILPEFEMVRVDDAHTCILTYPLGYIYRYGKRRSHKRTLRSHAL